MAQEQTIPQKIDELFRYRRIPQLLKLGGIPRDGAFVNKLMALQESIYLLDTYLETNWDVTKSGLASHWKTINGHLKELGLNRNEVVRYRKDIERYQAYELDMRSGKLPTKRAFKTTYGAKSCDVTLIRKLIYKEAPTISRLIRLSDWHPYDLVTEVNDDIDDVHEDRELYNGNRFLISLIVEGKRKTQSSYNGFIKEIGKMAHSRFARRNQKEAQELAEWTDKRIEQTKSLLKKKLGQKKIAEVKTATIAEKIKK